MAAGNSLKILHVLRAPVGGLFRHVLDLARGQIARGHHVGLIADAYTGGAWAEQRLAELAPALALGISRIAMNRQIGLSDILAAKQVARRAAEANADVVHGHGAKGGAYARLVTSDRAIRAYTPHGGSLHFSWSSPAGFSYLASERFLARRTELFLFESEYGRSVFERKLGRPRALARVVHNGIGPEEFAAIAPQPGASDVVFVGELRMLKGVDVLIEAIAALRRRGKSLTATIVGEGPDRQALGATAEARGLGREIRFVGTRPAPTAFALGRILVVPSRAQSLPYVVLEAAAAQVPMISTGVGGISEIFGPDAASLIPAGDAGALANAIENTLSDQATARALAQRLQERVRTLFSVDAMTEAVLAAYEEALAAR
jgi:glycosyltransferase involved in cell wall biosynthesis